MYIIIALKYRLFHTYIHTYALQHKSHCYNKIHTVSDEMLQTEHQEDNKSNRMQYNDDNIRVL